MNLYERGYLSNLSLFKRAVEKGLVVEYLDIETSTSVGCFYGHKKLFINRRQIKVPLKITSVVIMNEKDKKPLVLSWEWTGPIVMDYKEVKGGGDDLKLLKTLVPRLNKADLIVIQNGDKYDIPVIQDRLVLAGLSPLKNIVTLCTLKSSKRSLYKVSHSLDARSYEYGYGGKIKQDMDDCIAVSLGDPKKQVIRLKYNTKDVVDMRKALFREFNYLNLSSKFLNFLRTYIKEDKIYCIKCAARRQSRFYIKKIIVVKKLKGSDKKERIMKWECENCMYRWNLKSKNVVFKKDRWYYV